MANPGLVKIFGVVEKELAALHWEWKPGVGVSGSIVERTFIT